jgi:hemerythrin-like metal-binding protein
MEPTLRDPDAPAPANSASFTWTDARLLGFKPMDDTHEDFYRVAQALLISDESTVLDALKAFERHAVEHFEQEDEWMRTTEFPPRDCHIEEHEAVLKSTREVIQMVTEGRGGVPLAHDFAVYLFQWFPGHADYLDSALAAWMSKQTFGGKPVVLRRGVTKGG